MQTLGHRLAVVMALGFGVVASIATSSGEEDRCQADSDVLRCVGACAEFAALLREPLTPPPRITQGQCVRFAGRVGCGCFVDDERDPDALGGDDLRFPGDAFVDEGECTVLGRLGECLYDPAEFPGCTLPVREGGLIDDEGSETVCAAVCAAVDERRQAAAAARPNATVDESRCEFDCSCRVVDGEACGFAYGVEPPPEGATPDEAAALVHFSACSSLGT